MGALLARETARHRPEADYRALAASSFLGLGSVWAQGLSSSAALQMATAGQMQPRIRDIVAAGSARGRPGSARRFIVALFTTAIGKGHYLKGRLEGETGF